MPRRSFTAVIEKNRAFTQDFVTEPNEAGWASEARWFVRIMDWSGEGTTLTLHPEVSPDGLFWCPEGSLPLTITEPGLYSFPLREFGQWLRLRGEVTGTNPMVKVLIYLALKEYLARLLVYE